MISMNINMNACEELLDVFNHFLLNATRSASLQWANPFRMSEMNSEPEFSLTINTLIRSHPLISSLSYFWTVPVGASISAFFFFFSSLNPQPGTQLLKLQLPGPVNHVGRVHGEPQHRGVHLLTLLGLLGFDGLEVFLRLKKGRTQKRVRKKRFP